MADLGGHSAVGIDDCKGSSHADRRSGGCADAAGTDGQLGLVLAVQR